MLGFIHSLFESGAAGAPWDSLLPIREELFGIERLEQHALSLATAQVISVSAPSVIPLQVRLNDNAETLLKAYKASAEELELGHSVVPAAEWLLDNYHLVEAQISEVKDDLPPRFYRQLPKLASGPFAGYPRVFGIAWAFIAHTDSHFDANNLHKFVGAYQSITPLTIGELWAVAITLRIVLIENLRRLADQITLGRTERAAADSLTDKLLISGPAQSVLLFEIESRSSEPLSEVFSAQLAKGLRDQDPRTTPALEWLEKRLLAQGTNTEEVVANSQAREGASNVSIRNVITSMRLISDIDWTEQFERFSLVDKKLRSESDFSDMDFRTRNAYRSEIEQLARGSKFSELRITERVLEAAKVGAKTGENALEAQRLGDPGYYLLDKGRAVFEQSLEFTPSLGLRLSRLHLYIGLKGYIAAIITLAVALVVAAFMIFNVAQLPLYYLLLMGLIALLPATEISTAVINRSVTWRLRNRFLPSLELKEGVPSSLRTLIAVPALLTNEVELLEQVERLEVHYLAGMAGDLSFALLLDGLDADKAVLASDQPLLNTVSNAIQQLNQRHACGPAGKRFFMLYRCRQFNHSENKWIAWERKRGKLHELNRLLRGASDTSFIAQDANRIVVPENVRYVITLDADTRLPRETALRLVGKMGHPLNRPRFNATTQRVEAGYGIIQPRVTPSLPVGLEGSFYQRVISSPGGMDPYAAATSDVYQDLFGEGSFTGKGIYDIDAFEASLAGRIKDNTVLSHDLFEGIFTRAALVSDIEVVEEFPARYDVIAKRQHRWTRGDWQLLPWIFGQFSGSTSVSWLGRWKLLDNLRRSLVGPITFLGIVLSWLLPMPLAMVSILLLLSTMFIPVFMPAIFSFKPSKPSVDIRNHMRAWLEDLRLSTFQAVFAITFLPDQSYRSIDGIIRTVYRLFFSRRQLIEWTSAAQINSLPRLTLAGFYQTMWPGTLISQALSLVLMIYHFAAWPIILPFACLWLAAPAIALYCSQAKTSFAKDRDEQYDVFLRLTARKTWRYFETFVTSDNNMLPPDNFQETPEKVVAHRTSPTNIGLYMLSTVAARDFAWIGLNELIERLEVSFASIDMLPKFKGHLYNWYSTQSLQILLPAYVSSVDSGNLAGHLIAIANACDEWRENPCAESFHFGIDDNFALLKEAVQIYRKRYPEDAESMDEMVSLLAKDLANTEALQTKSASILLHLDNALAMLASRLPFDSNDHDDILFWLKAMAKLVHEKLRDQQTQSDDPLRDSIAMRLKSLAKRARELAYSMDFSFLMDTNRKLMSIGYSQDENSLDVSCYDLLASEARLASLFAIAKGDTSTKHWFRLGRTATPLSKGAALISWSGSMFEYLMPSLVMRAPTGSLLEQTNRLVVARQAEYGAQLGIPWGISESAFNARDIEFTYQYSNFGVPGLGLKRGLSENRVIAPYATALATMVDPLGALKNYQRLQALGACGRFGFYEAIDFTPTRVPRNTEHAIIHSFMAHHQGMTIVAILNCLKGGLMRSRFHKEPSIQACELLLQERIPRDIASEHPRAEEVKASVNADVAEAITVRKVNVCNSQTPTTHILSNGRYSVMLTEYGGGYSRWRDFMVTRWFEDSTSDLSGSQIFLRDLESGKTWSATSQLFGANQHFNPCLFAEDHASYSMRQGNLNTSMDVLVSGEDDGEVRRVSVQNIGHFSHEIELTSFAELVLATAANDNAHPAFSKMFVKTEFIEEFQALIATRRKRSKDDKDIWAGHFALVENGHSSAVSYESSRANFIGRGNTIVNASAISTGKTRVLEHLSNTVGCVLDPIFALRHRVKIDAGALVRISFWTVVAESRTELLDMIDRHHDLSAFDRAKTLAWTQEQVQLRHLGITSAEVADFQRLSAPILYNDPRFRAQSKDIVNGMRCQSELWAHSISGDLPIVLLRIDHIEDIETVKQLLRAHEYWRIKGLKVDLVIINEHPTWYRQDLQNALDTAVRSSQSRPRSQREFVTELPLGSVHVFRADLLAANTQQLLHAIARVVLVARHGLINRQIPLRTSKSNDNAAYEKPKNIAARTSPTLNKAEKPSTELEFFNGTGGFAEDGQEYEIRLNQGKQTPAPWINVIANANFGFLVSAEGSSSTWSENSRDNQLTPWSNDAVSDPIAEIAYVYDKESNQIYTATAKPSQDDGQYTIRHGRGYSRFEHSVDGLCLDLLQYVPLTDPIKISRLRLKNTSGRTRKLSVTAYMEWVLGNTRNPSSAFLTSKLDPGTNAILVSKCWNTSFSERVAFADMGGKQTAWTSNRTEFLGRRGSKCAPHALLAEQTLSGQMGAGYDICTALQRDVELLDLEECEIVIFIGQAASEQDALELIKRYRQRNLSNIFDDVQHHWQTILNKVQVKTPDRAMDIMLNGWLMYQTIACRISARASFYQASGAYGFRDQLQDGMALTMTQPEMTRAHLLRAAARQFIEGDVQHWWLPHSGQGVRTHISDDRVWLTLATARYIKTSDDLDVLHETIPFLEGRQLSSQEHDAYFTPSISEQSASLFEHCARGLDQCIALTGTHGLPLMGTGDWNDGMNLVGANGKGESVWLAWLLIHAIDTFATYAFLHDAALTSKPLDIAKQDALTQKRPETNCQTRKSRIEKWQAHAERLRKDIDKHAWDGKWYRRATFDDGTWLGSSQNDECRIDSIAQSWSILADALDENRVNLAMNEAKSQLIQKENAIALLFTPPFDKTERNPGYIKGYPPGLRENGGQYSHAAMWLILALAKQGKGDEATALFAMLNPINHANNAANTACYKVEPYVVAADVYSVAPYIGRGGWTWYTGAAGWMYQAGIEGILGIRREGSTLIVCPNIPDTWPGFSATLDFDSRHIVVVVDNKITLRDHQLVAEFNGESLQNITKDVRIELISGRHSLTIGARAKSESNHKDKLL